MSHFAKIEDGIVTQVIVAEQPFIDGVAGEWVQTSYNNNIRANFAGKGYTYDSVEDVFVAPQPFPSWELDDTVYKWQAPVERPIGFYEWDEDIGDWIAID